MSIDTLDMKIISCLIDNAKRTYRSISEDVGVSEATVKNRIDRLMESGVIKKFTVVLDYHKLGRAIKAFIGLKVQPAKLQAIVEHMKEHPDVFVLYRTSGDVDLLFEVIFEMMEDLNAFLEKELRSSSDPTSDVHGRDSSLAPCILLGPSGYEDGQTLYLGRVLLQLYLKHGFKIAAKIGDGYGTVFDLYLFSDLREGAPSEVLQLLENYHPVSLLCEVDVSELGLQDLPLEGGHAAGSVYLELAKKLEDIEEHAPVHQDDAAVPNSINIRQPVVH